MDIMMVYSSGVSRVDFFTAVDAAEAIQEARHSLRLATDVCIHTTQVVTAEIYRVAWGASADLFDHDDTCESKTLDAPDYTVFNAIVMSHETCDCGASRSRAGTAVFIQDVCVAIEPPTPPCDDAGPHAWNVLWSRPVSDTVPALGHVVQEQCLRCGMMRQIDNSKMVKLRQLTPVTSYSGYASPSWQKETL